MTIGPMRCQGCGGRVWWRDARLVMPYMDGWRRHSCKQVLDARANGETIRFRTPDYWRAYNRDWMRRKRAAA